MNHTILQTIDEIYQRAQEDLRKFGAINLHDEPNEIDIKLADCIVILHNRILYLEQRLNSDNQTYGAQIKTLQERIKGLSERVEGLEARENVRINRESWSI